MNIPSLYSLPMFYNATSAVHGYTTRSRPVGGWFDELISGIGGTSSGLVGIGKQFLESATTKAIIEGKKAIGYKAIGPVVVNGVPYYKMTNLQGVPVLINSAGVESPVTPATQAAEQKIDSSGNIITGVSIGVGVIAAGAILYLLLRRK